VVIRIRVQTNLDASDGGFCKGERQKWRSRGEGHSRSYNWTREMGEVVVYQVKAQEQSTEREREIEIERKSRDGKERTEQSRSRPERVGVLQGTRGGGL
jgi:hypothetical protein